MTNNITTVVLTANEEDNIERCLNSIKWCDEILLIDNSNDYTSKVAGKLQLKQLKILKNSESNDFAKLRNLALKQAKNEWVLFIDADEEVPDKLRKEIIKNISDSKVDGYFIPRRDYFLGRWLKYGETRNIKMLKLGKKNSGNWVRPVHEVWRIEKTGELKNSLNHYPHPTVTEFMSRIHRWSSLDARYFYDQGIRSNFLKIIFYPLGKFTLNYFIRLGLLDGMPGLIMALMMSFHSFLTRAKLFLMQQKIYG